MITLSVRRLIASSILLIAVASFLAWESRAGEEDSIDAPSRAALRVPLHRREAQLSPLGSFVAIVNRPLFVSTRRPQERKPIPPPPPPTAVSAGPPPILAASLIGILIAPKGGSAILRLRDGTSAVIVEGGSVQGWTLRRVSADSAVFVQAADETALIFPRHQSPLESRIGLPSIPVVTRRRNR